MRHRRRVDAGLIELQGDLRDRVRDCLSKKGFVVKGLTYNGRMPKLTVEGYGTVDVADGKRLVLAIEQDAKVDILHACGGNARCTTCRVEFIDGEPATHTAAEIERLAATRPDRRAPVLPDSLRSRYDGARDQPPRRIRPSRSGKHAGTRDHAAAGLGLT